VAIGSRALEVFSALFEHRERVLTKAELLASAWQGLVVEENNLSVQISALRKLLGEHAIATVAGRGFRWALEVEAASAAGAPPAKAAASPAPRRGKPSIVVLPFTSLSDTPGQEWLADGIAEDVGASLARSPWLFVTASASANALRDRAHLVAEVGATLGVDYVLRGTIRREAGRLRVSAELLTAADAELVWAERCDAPDTDQFVVQDAIVARIVGTLEPAFLKQEEKRASAVAAADLAHWDLVMRARWHYWRSSRRHVAESERLLREALARRPDDPAALALLSFCLATAVWSGWATDPKAMAVEARRLATRAAALNDSDAFAHFALGVAHLSFGDLPSAMREHGRALELHPHFAAAAAELGRLHAFRGETDEARRLVRQAMRDSPTDPRLGLWEFSLGIAGFVDGDWHAAAFHARRGTTLRRDWFFNHLLLAAALAEQGEAGPAREAVAEATRLVPSLTVAALRVGHPFVREADAERYVAALRKAGWTAG
jgi:TolB-like protein